MSLLNVETGELVEPLTRVDAERLTTRIRLRLDTIADNYAAVMPLIREAIERQAYAALGYTGVSQYVSECFGDALSQLGVEVRREVVRELTEAGMSTRAIAPVVGVSHMTVKADRDSGVKPFTPDPQAPESPAEGEAAADSGQTPQGEAAPEATPSATVPSETGPTTPSPRPAVTGLDGKTYTPSVASKPKRKPITDSFFAATHETRLKVESLRRLVDDDRFPQNAEKAAAANRGDLLRIKDLLEQVIDALPTQEGTNA